MDIFARPARGLRDHVWQQQQSLLHRIRTAQKQFGSVMSQIIAIISYVFEQASCMRWAMPSFAGGGLILLACPVGVTAQDTPDYYRQNCMNCHTIGGGRLTGPDLKKVSQRKDTEWLINFIINPKGVVDSGDPYAKKLVEESRGVVMPIGPGMNRYRAEQILKLIEAESKLEESQFKGLRISNEPFTEQDRLRGRDLFQGLIPLKNGGAACNCCHTMHDLATLGGGRLGPDLTRVYERLKGRAAMAAWLFAPATETMQPIFKNHPLDAAEIHSLTAYFETSAPQSEQSPMQGRVAFLLMGLGVAAGLIMLLDSFWAGRFEAVRRPLVSRGVEDVHSRFDLSDTTTAVQLAAAAGKDASHAHAPRGNA